MNIKELCEKYNAASGKQAIHRAMRATHNEGTTVLDAEYEAGRALAHARAVGTEKEIREAKARFEQCRQRCTEVENEVRRAHGLKEV